MGYKEKDYNKGTAEIKTRIDDIHARTRYISGAGDSGVGMILSKIGRLVDRTLGKTIKLDGKQMKEIDKRIYEILDLMDTDVQAENIPALSSHAELLFDLVKKERLNGKKFYDDRYLESGKAKADAMGEMLKSLEEKARFQEKIAELKADARRAKAAGDMVELQKIDLEYQKCNNEIERCDGSLEDWRLSYNRAVQTQSELDKAKEVDKILATNLKTMSPAEFNRQVAETNKKLQTHIEQASEINEIYEDAKKDREQMRGGAKSSSRSIMDDIQQEDAVNAQKDIESAAAPVTTSNVEFKVSKGLLDD